MLDDKLMRTTLDLDVDILQAVKELAQVRGTTAGSVVSDLVRKALQSSARTARVRNGVPLLRHRQGAPLMTMALVNELRDAE